MADSDNFKMREIKVGCGAITVVLAIIAIVVAGLFWVIIYLPFAGPKV